MSTGARRRPLHAYRAADGTWWRAGKRLWTAAEDARLRKLYPHQSTVTVAQQLGRSLSSVYARAQGVLGLRKSAAYLASPESDRRHSEHRLSAGRRR